MTVTLPDDVPALKDLSEQEIKRELAVSLYAARKLTIVQAANLAGANLFDFQALLRERCIPQHYNESELQKDLLVLRELDER